MDDEAVAPHSFTFIRRERHLADSDAIGVCVEMSFFVTVCHDPWIRVMLQHWPQT